ncbi:MAG: RDD family protein [Vicinamibacterales bacterium]
MKCPKCGYLGYQDVDRCRNCGNEFTMVAPSAPSELRLRDAEPERNPIADLELIDNRMAASAQASDAAANLANAANVAKPAEASPTPGGRIEASVPGGRIDLPLFGVTAPDDRPLITRAPPPRPPLSVRRATPEVPRLRAESRMPVAESPVAAPPTPAPAVKSEPPIIAAPFQPARSPQLTRSPRQVAGGLLPPASGFERVKAGLIDVGLLLLVDVVVVYFALKVCRLSVSEIGLLPRVPLAAFLLLQNGGYLIAFTATGQTLGKMVTGLRVVTAHDSLPGFGRATVRSLLSLVLALPAGLGLLPAVLSNDGRGLHDRLAGTRVVRSID